MLEYGSTSGQVQLYGVRESSVPSSATATFVTKLMFRLGPDMRSNIQLINLNALKKK